MRVCLHGAFWLAMVAAVTGCAHSVRRPTRTAFNADPLEALLPPTRTHPLPLSGYYDRLVGTPDAVDEQLRPSQPSPAEYRQLSPEQCQCLAVKASTEGNRLTAERQALKAIAAHRLTRKEQLKIQVLWAAELEARNRSASSALKVYYQIAQAEANRPVLAKSVEELDDALRKIGRMRENGMQIPFDDGELKRQRLAVSDQQLKLTAELDQLNAELVQLIGLSSTEARPRIWPSADYTVHVGPTNIDEAVALGLATRPELKLLASLRSSLNVTNVGITRGVVGGPNSAAASSLSRVCKFICGRCSNLRELPTRERQLAQHYDQRRREVTAEIQQAVLELESRLRRIAVEKQVVTQWRTEIDDLAKKKQIDEATFLDVSRARLKRLQAESDEIEQIIGWEIARVKLKEAQGMLVSECQGHACRFLDFAAVPASDVVLPPELVVPQETLPDDRAKSDGVDDAAWPPMEGDASAPRPGLPPPLVLPAAAAKSIVNRTASEADTMPPDIAAEAGQ